LDREALEVGGARSEVRKMGWRVSAEPGLTAISYLSVSWVTDGPSILHLGRAWHPALEELTAGKIIFMIPSDTEMFFYIFVFKF
jgi:hypothetical protein